MVIKVGHARREVLSVVRLMHELGLTIETEDGMNPYQLWLNLVSTGDFTCADDVKVALTRAFFISDVNEVYLIIDEKRKVCKVVSDLVDFDYDFEFFKGVFRVPSLRNEGKRLVDLIECLRPSALDSLSEVVRHQLITPLPYIAGNCKESKKTPFYLYQEEVDAINRLRLTEKPLERLNLFHM